MEFEISKTYDFEKPIKPTTTIQAVPTLDRRHASWIREGRQSSEVYARNPQRRHELGLPIISMESDEF